MSMQEDENILVNPKDTKIKETDEDKQIPEKYKEDLKYTNFGGKVGINFESHGRFGSPEKMYFKDFTGKNIDDLTLCKPTDLLETLVSILNERKFESNFDVGDLLIEEFTEVLMGLKQSLHPRSSKEHPHRWMCKCQYHLPEDKRELSKSVIDLTSVKYKSIYDIDEELKEFYKNNTNLPENEIESLKAAEPIIVHDTTSDEIYEFRLNRVSDLIKASKMAEEKYNPKMHRVKARQVSNKSLEDVEYEKSEELKKLEEEKAKYAFRVAKALTLEKVNGKEVNFEQKLQLFDSMGRVANSSYKAFLSLMQIGIVDEREFICNICNKYKERGYLQQRINPIELIPLSNDEDPSSDGRPQIDPSISILFGTKT